MSSMFTGHAHSGSGSSGRESATPVRQYSRAAASAISAGSWP